MRGWPADLPEVVPARVEVHCLSREGVVLAQVKGDLSTAH